MFVISILNELNDMLDCNKLAEANSGMCIAKHISHF